MTNDAGLMAVIKKLMAEDKTPQVKEEPKEKMYTLAEVEQAIKDAREDAIKNNSPDLGAPTSGADVLTIDSIKNMSEEQINENWDKVSEVLRQQTREGA